MKSVEQILDKTMLQQRIRMGWIPDTKQAVILYDAITSAFNEFNLTNKWIKE